MYAKRRTIVYFGLPWGSPGWPPGPGPWKSNFEALSKLSHFLLSSLYNFAFRPPAALGGLWQGLATPAVLTLLRVSDIEVSHLQNSRELQFATVAFPMYS